MDYRDQPAAWRLIVIYQMTNPDNIKYSIVVPVYNSENTLRELFIRINRIFSEMQTTYEVVFVEDGGHDNSWKVLRQLQEEYPDIITAIRLNKNYGQHNATFCGLDHAKGEILITIDDDLQTPPEEIVKLISVFKSEHKPDIVYGFYKQKKHTVIRNLGSRMLKFYTKTFFRAPGKGSSFRLFTQEIKDHLLNHRNTIVYIDEILLWYSGNLTFVEVEHRPSEKGRSGYSFIKLIRLFINVILYSTVTPLKIMVYGGFFFAIVSFFIGLVFIYRKMVYQVPLGYTSIIVTILFSTGILLFFLGIIGKYITRIYLIQNKKPSYLIRRKLSRNTGSGQMPESDNQSDIKPE
jgi:undecaprenyl-phosphate 4-deoxy-4-formamido-L-arabinose transferase